MAQEDEHIKAKEHIQKLKDIIFLNEKEKDEIGYELHENICQLVSASLLHIQMTKGNVAENEAAYLEEASYILHEVLSGLRTIAKNISPLTLKTLGLSSLIHNLCDLIREQKQTNCLVEIDENCITRLSLFFQNILYQVTQLQIINVIKCDNVENLVISILPSGDKIKMEIRNEGVCKTTTDKSSDEGFVALRNVIEAFGGTFELKMLNSDKGMNLTVHI